jgi:hypothetical protein
MALNKSYTQLAKELTRFVAKAYLVTQVVTAAKHTENLVMWRNSASHPLGALNLQIGEASAIIRSRHTG